MLAQVLERPELMPEITGRHRVGDIRHCYADTAAAEKEIGYRPSITLREGMQELGE
jgi:dTDP-L-rhamnose 4-epimerase